MEEASLPDPGFAPPDFAGMCGALGEVEECLRWLKRAVEVHSDLNFHSLRLDPAFEQARRDPGLEALLKKLKLR